MADVFGGAVADYYHETMTEPLSVRDGEACREHPIEAFYFEPFDPEGDVGRWLTEWVRGPLLDVGAGTGRHALVYQDRHPTVALDTSASLVDVMRERGVADARVGDMFALPSTFERDRFGSALVLGTQSGLAASMQGLRQLLGDLAFVTDAEATAVLDGYDPTRRGAADLLGYRDDPSRGLAHRVFHFAYEGQVSETLCFRLFSPARLREAAVGTGWEVAAVRRGADGPHYRAALAKR